MASATIFEAKTNLSELIKKVQAGEKVIITSGREKTPVAELTPIVARKPQRIGFLAHLNLPPIKDSVWFDPMPEGWDGMDETADDPLFLPERKPVSRANRSTRRRVVSK